MFKPQNSALWLALSCSQPIFAEQLPELAGEPVIITATRQVQPISKTLSDVSVITGDEIRESGAQNLVELLSRQPGVESTSTGGMGSMSSLFLRGSNANHTLILLDGMRIVAASAGLTALQHFPMAMIERIEIVRGPASSLYGADAIGGVIQIFTHQGGGKPSIQGSLGYGSHHTLRADTALQGKIDNTAYNISLIREQTRGFSATNAKSDSYNPDRDGYENTGYNARIRQTLAPGHDISLQLFQTFSRNDYDSSPIGQDVERSRQTGANIELRNQLDENWHSTLRFAQTQDKREDFNGGNLLSPASMNETTQNEWQWQHDLDTAAGKWLAAMVYSDQQVNAKASYMPNGYTVDSRDNKAALLGYQNRFGKHLLQASARRDINSQFSNKNTGSLGYGYQLNEQWLLRSSYGTAFKVPTFGDLYSPFGNPTLQPETSQNIETAIRWAKPGKQAELIWYRNNIDNLISYQGSQNKLLNKSARINGATLSASSNWEAWELAGSVTYQEPIDQRTQQQLVRRARAFGQLNASYDWGKVRTGIEGKLSSRRPDRDYRTFPYQDVWLPGYGIINLFADYSLNTEWVLNTRIDNLFSRDYEAAYGYNTGGFGWFISLRYQPKP
ncbi:TonB-dependent receptor [Neisseriaceae bacterium TC5R-5]|nr:TonB-dependent receptor [Neisseriaceae bacterium TC5R-5]